MQYYMIDVTYFQVVNGDLNPNWKIHPNNLWTLNPSTGLYDMAGGPTGISLDAYELRTVVRQVPVMQVGNTKRA
jgi:hypothetical protein